MRFPMFNSAALPANVLHSHSDDCSREIRWGVITGGAFLVLLFGWGSLTPLDSATYGVGQIIVSGHRQSIQYKETGIVSGVHVREGQKVHAGDVLIEMNGGEIRAQERALAGQVLTLRAQKVRLEAEQLHLAAIVWPHDLLAPSAEDADMAAKAIAVQKALFDARRSSLGNQKSVVMQKQAELGQQIEGYKRQIESSETQSKLVSEELKGVQGLADKGYAPQSRVRNLQRDQASISGQRGQYLAAVSQTRQQAEEMHLQADQLDHQRFEDIVTQLKDNQLQLGELEPKWAAAREQVSRQLIRAPVTGSVVGLKPAAAGTLIEAGERLMDIVPDKPTLVVEARVSPADAQDARVGADVEVKFPSLHDRQLRQTHAVLTKMSADALTDERTGASYFQAEATLTPKALTALEKADEGRFQLKPGLPAQVLIPMRHRTALQYLLDPLTDAIWRAFRER